MNSLRVTANSQNCLQKEKKNFTRYFTLSNGYKRFQQEARSPGANIRNRKR